MRKLGRAVIAALVILTLASCGPGATTSPAATSIPAITTTTSVQNTDVQQLVPVTTTTWWAVVAKNVTYAVLRTNDSGRHWQDVTPPIIPIGYSGAFLTADVAWVTSTVGKVYRTLDGGQTWQAMGTLPMNSCQLQFVSEYDGWCPVIGAAAGSENFDLYRTVDGGVTWTLASSTGIGDNGDMPGDVPFGCDKTFTFTSPTVGWISSACNGGTYYLFTSDDGGSHWRRRGVPLPPGVSTPVGGSELGPPVVKGSGTAVSLQINGTSPGRAPTGTTAIAVSADGGSTWHTQLAPQAHDGWSVDLIDPSHWRFTDGTTFLATDDAGAHWASWAPTVSMKGSYGVPLTLRFISPLVGWATPLANGGPMWWTIDGGIDWKAVKVPGGSVGPPGHSVRRIQHQGAGQARPSTKAGRSPETRRRLHRQGLGR